MIRPSTIHTHTQGPIGLLQPQGAKAFIESLD